MGFLKRDDGAQQQDQEQAAQAQQAPVEDAPSAGSYQAGSLADVPEAGRARMERMRKAAEARVLHQRPVGQRASCWSREAGFEPLGLVLGSSIYHIGFQQAQWNQSQEMGVLTQAMYHARELAMTRMEEEADQLGADGVVGVRLDDRPL